ncbi:unnamed protein product [Owenia fusiformis]|uniref:Uncharacterized protein n=1 Tax=Owenia fusiformis TaxID=6347 RepID=A0A8J1UKT8_OWEFU|nr:unnamed protein product [Owenia fusiformis]
MASNYSWNYSLDYGLSNITYNGSLGFSIEDSFSVYRFVAISTVLLLLAFITNSFSIAAIHNIPGANSCSHKLFLNLAVAETLNALVTYLEVAPRVMWLKLAQGQISPYTFVMLKNLQTVQFILFAFFYCASGITLLELAILRFVAIRYPMSYSRLFSIERWPIIISSIWIGAIILALPGLCVFGNFGNKCAFWNYIWPCGLIAIFITIFVLYGIVSVLLVAMSKSRTCRHQEENRKAIVTTVILICSLMVVAVPYITVKLLRYHYHSPLIQTIQDNFICILPYFNFIFDPFVYGIRTKDIRDGYAHLNTICGLKSRTQRFAMVNNTVNGTSQTNCEKATEMVDMVAL